MGGALRPDITRARKAVLEWLRLRLLGSWTSILELSKKVPVRGLFSSPAPILEIVHEAMDALCLEVGEEPISSYRLFRELHPVLMLHWRVQAYLVGHLSPDSRMEYCNAIVYDM